MNDKQPDSEAPPVKAASLTAIDPVCGMTVDVAHAAGSHVHDGSTYFFCNRSCEDRFKKDPHKYVTPEPDTSQPHTTSATIDPVCGMSVLPGKAAATTDFAGKHYEFCSQHCEQKFNAAPERYTNETPPAVPTLSAGGSSFYTCPMHPEVRQSGPGICPKCGMGLEPIEAPAISTTDYVCPMHPEVVSDHPGACPKCGMALEPRTVALNAGPSREELDMTRRFWFGLLLGLPVFVIAMSEMLPGNPLHHWAHILNWVQLLLATPVVFWSGWPFFERAWHSVRNLTPNMFTLIALGVGSSFLYSLVATISPHLFPPEMQHADGTVMPYFDTAVTVTVLILLGQVLELKARSQTSGAIRRLLSLAPTMARRVSPNGTEEEVVLTSIQRDDLLRVRPGDKVPADGVVVEGHSTINESMISGEPLPIEKQTDDKVIAATINGTGTLLIRAEKVGADTMLAQIVRMVNEAQRTRAPIEKIVDRVSRFFVPAVVLVSLLTFAVWSVWGAEPRMAHALFNSVAVLIIACPCALGLATPMSIMVGIGRGAENGILIKNAEALERLHRADILVVDKTGTLTEGKPRLVTVEPADGFTSEDVLRWAASLEKTSEHPLAEAIIAGTLERGIAISATEYFQSITGKGVAGIVDGKKVSLGNLALMEEQTVPIDRVLSRMDELRGSGQTVVCLALDGRFAGLIGVADRIKATTPDAIRMLHAEGMRVIMLTGDSRRTAAAVAATLGIDEVIADVLPSQKVEAIERLQAQGHVVAMAGDGINDAPALAKADIGIAMGTGTDVAIESAGITLIKGDLGGIRRARVLSRLTMNNIRQNLFLAFFYNAASVPVAAGVLYPYFGLLITPIWASVAMSVSSLSVVANALRLRRLRF